MHAWDQRPGVATSCEARRGVAKRQERVSWAIRRRSETSAVGGVGAAAQEHVGLQSLSEE